MNGRVVPTIFSLSSYGFIFNQCLTFLKWCSMTRRRNTRSIPCQSSSCQRLPTRSYQLPVKPISTTPTPMFSQRKLTYLLRNSVNSRHQMRSREHRNDTGIHHPNAPNTINP
jgi:hypothetical protein